MCYYYSLVPKLQGGEFGGVSCIYAICPCYYSFQNPLKGIFFIHMLSQRIVLFESCQNLRSRSTEALVPNDHMTCGPQTASGVSVQFNVVFS